MKAFLPGSLLLVLSVGCTEPEDRSSLVHDLRVLGVSTERPELMAPSCEPVPEALEALAEEVTFRALLVDPRDGAREVRYELFACASTTNSLCDAEDEKALLAEGTTSPGELTLRIRPGAAWLPDGTLLLDRVREKDPYQGLGGVRMPLVLHVTAEEEEVFAEKLLVFNCPLVPGMEANQTPRLPGLRLLEEPWAEEALPVLEGQGPFEVESEDVDALEEAYVVPGFRGEAIPLEESWKVSWHATLGKFEPEETGGLDLGCTKGPPCESQRNAHRTEWEPPEEGGTEQIVTFWAVVRDGRGGQSWLTRRARWIP